MRAIRVEQFGGPEVLKLENNVPVPQPNQGQVLVEVKAIGISPGHTYIRAGLYGKRPKQFPYTPGAEMSGIVKEIGPNVCSFKPGDRVYVIRTVGGSYAEYAVAEENMVSYLDDSLTFEQGATGVSYYTAYKAIIFCGKAKAGQTILIHGASGGAGIACVQIAKARGLTVYGTAGTQEGLDLVLNNGAAAAFNHREEGYMDKILEATDADGPDVIVEMLANKNLEMDLQIVKRSGIIVVVGSRGTIEINPETIKMKECIVTGMRLYNTSESELKEMHKAMAEGVKDGWLRPHIGKKYRLEEAPLAHDEIINSGKTLGKRVFKL